MKTSWYGEALALLALCEENAPVVPSQRVSKSFYVFFTSSLNKLFEQWVLGAKQLIELTVIWDATSAHSSVYVQ